jgi:hypothetical protein
MPAQGEVVAAYLIALMDATASIAKVEEAAEAIVHAHENRGRHIDPVFICAAITWARDAWEGARILNGGQL